jgi:hypothetical protein
MAIVSITERWSGDSLDEQSPDARHFTLGATRVLDILVDDPANDNSFTIGASLGDPTLRSAYPQDFFLRCNNLQIVRTSPIRFELRASYFMQGNLFGGPLSLPPIISWGSIVTEEEVPYDANGNGFVTGIGEAFDPPPRVPVYDRLLTVTRNVANYDDSWAGSFRNAVNSAPFYTYPAGTVRVVNLDAQSVLDVDFQYWTVTGTFQIRRATNVLSDAQAWYYAIQAKGMICKNDAGSGYRYVTADGTDSGAISPVPMPHDTSTFKQLAPGASIQYYKFQVFQSADLNQLGLV